MIKLRSKKYIEGWLKGNGWRLKKVPWQSSDELTHYVHKWMPGFAFNTCMFEWLDEDISKYIHQDILGSNMYNLLRGVMIHPDWLERSVK